MVITIMAWTCLCCSVAGFLWVCAKVLPPLFKPSDDHVHDMPHGDVPHVPGLKVPVLHETKGGL